MERLMTSNVSISYCNTKEFQPKIYCKNWFSDRAFYATFADADIVS